ncbi:MAG: DUF484 family protein [Alphaproteobacteria bacterium]|nr:DUF484 family protein [Alphaproteobacteria bacterium]
MAGPSPQPEGAGQAPAPADPQPEAVRAFLARHPEFLAQHPDLLLAQDPPTRFAAGNVHDLQAAMLRRLQAALGELTRQRGELIAAGRHNMAVQTQVHEAVLAMLEATSFEHLIHIVTNDLRDTLLLDAVTLGVEAQQGEAARRAKTPGVFVLAAGGIDLLLGRGEVLLAQPGKGDAAIFGPAAKLVASQALVRLSASRLAPVGLLALGSRDPERFHPGQGTELLQFLAHVLARLIRGWLHLPR